MADQLRHDQLARILSDLHNSKVINLDVTIRNLIEPISGALKADPGGTVNLHVLCCNEYALVTGLQGGSLQDIKEQVPSLRETLGQ